MITGTPETMVPANFGAVTAGSIMSQFYTKEMAEKYSNGNETKVRLNDFASHWFPALVLYSLYHKKVNNRHLVMALSLPLMYFSVKHDKNNVRLVNPVKHLQETYPGVPIWVFSMYAIGAVLSTKVNKAS